MGFFSSSRSAAPEFVDYWTPERLKGGVSKFQSIHKPEALDPIYAREADRLRQGISGAYASRGFGALRTGPAAYREAEGLRQFGETRAAGEEEQLMNFLRMLQSGAVSYTPQKGPSGFAALAGPLLGAAGYGIGGPVGSAIGSRIGGAFRTSQTVPPSDLGFGGDMGFSGMFT